MTTIAVLKKIKHSGLNITADINRAIDYLKKSSDYLTKIIYLPEFIKNRSTKYTPENISKFHEWIADYYGKRIVEIHKCIDESELIISKLSPLIVDYDKQLSSHGESGFNIAAIKTAIEKLEELIKSIKSSLSKYKEFSKPADGKNYNYAERELHVSIMSDPSMIGVVASDLSSIIPLIKSAIDDLSLILNAVYGKIVSINTQHPSWNVPFNNQLIILDANVAKEVVRYFSPPINSTNSLMITDVVYSELTKKPTDPKLAKVPLITLSEQGYFTSKNGFNVQIIYLDSPPTQTEIANVETEWFTTTKGQEAMNNTWKKAQFQNSGEMSIFVYAMRNPGKRLVVLSNDSDVKYVVDNLKKGRGMLMNVDVYNFKNGQYIRVA